jgi:hypothetical protein
MGNFNTTNFVEGFRLINIMDADLGRTKNFDLLPEIV